MNNIINLRNEKHINFSSSYEKDEHQTTININNIQILFPNQAPS